MFLIHLAIKKLDYRYYQILNDAAMPHCREKSDCFNARLWISWTIELVFMSCLCGHNTKSSCPRISIQQGGPNMAMINWADAENNVSKFYLVL